MLVFKLEIDYYDLSDELAKKLLQLSPEIQRRINHIFGSDPFVFNDLDSGAVKFEKFRLPEIVVDLALVDELESYGLPCKLSRVRGLNYPNSYGNDIRSTNIAHDPQVVQVSVASVGLLDITSVEVCEDLCTISLQSYLNEGWKIIAVCPPNDSRRPTYILGHVQKGKRL